MLAEAHSRKINTTCTQEKRYRMPAHTQLTNPPHGNGSYRVWPRREQHAIAAGPVGSGRKNPVPADRDGVVCPPDTWNPVAHSMHAIMGKHAVDRACKTGLTLTRTVTAWSETAHLLAGDPTKQNWRACPVACTHRTSPATPPGTHTDHGQRTEHTNRPLDVVPRPGAAAKLHAKTIRPGAGGIARPVPPDWHVFGG